MEEWKEDLPGASSAKSGDLAQLGERLPCTQEVVSSSLIVSMAVGQLKSLKLLLIEEKAALTAGKK